MRPSPADPLDRIFAALADPTRRAILARLAEGETPVGPLAARFPLSPPAISRHLKVLEGAGLIRRRTKAQARIIALKPDALKRASDHLERYRAFWSASLARLGDLLEAEAATPRPSVPDDPTFPSKESPDEPDTGP